LQRNNDIENAAKVYEKLKSEITKTMEERDLKNFMVLI
jgi:hypothetical protein